MWAVTDVVVDRWWMLVAGFFYCLSIFFVVRQNHTARISEENAQQKFYRSFFLPSSNEQQSLSFP
jgi:hypothetical protein